MQGAEREQAEPTEAELGWQQHRRKTAGDNRHAR